MTAPDPTQQPPVAFVRAKVNVKTRQVVVLMFVYQEGAARKKYVLDNQGIWNPIDEMQLQATIADVHWYDDEE